MKIFISHSMVDKDLVNGLNKMLKPSGFTLFIAEHHYDVEKTITEKIEFMIKQSHVALVLLTENGFKSSFVQQEIGYLKSLKKPFLLIVQKGLESKIGGFAYGKDAIILDPLDTTKALKSVKNLLLNYWNKLYNKQLKEKEAQERDKNAAKLIVGGLATLFLVGLLKK